MIVLLCMNRGVTFLLPAFKIGNPLIKFFKEVRATKNFIKDEMTRRVELFFILELQQNVIRPNYWKG